MKTILHKIRIGFCRVRMLENVKTENVMLNQIIGNRARFPKACYESVWTTWKKKLCRPVWVSSSFVPGCMKLVHTHKKVRTLRALVWNTSCTTKPNRSCAETARRIVFCCVRIDECKHRNRDKLSNCADVQIYTNPRSISGSLCMENCTSCHCSVSLPNHCTRENLTRKSCVPAPWLFTTIGKYNRRLPIEPTSL